MALDQETIERLYKEHPNNGKSPFTEEERAERFWAQVKKGRKNQCWLWQGKLHRDGYGITKYKGLTSTAHRHAYRLTIGEPTHKRVLHHTCGNKICCNPDHMIEVSRADKMFFNHSEGKIPHGAHHYGAKLTVEDVKEIRRSKLTNDALAEKYSMHPRAIRKVRNRETWKSVK